MDLKTQLTTARETLVARLVEFAANPKPNYTIEGQTVSYGDYLKMLIDGVREISGLISVVAPYELRSRME